MKKIISILFMLTGFLFALDGSAVYEKSCSSCHRVKGGMNMSTHMKAPPMMMVSARLKKMIDSKEKFIAFVDDYIQNPAQAKGHCMSMAYKRFGIMPPIGKGLSEQERLAVAKWLYENFNNRRDDSMSAKMCGDSAGKCGGSMNSSAKCGAGKCGSN